MVGQGLPDQGVVGRAQPQGLGQVQVAVVVAAQQGVRATEQPVSMGQADGVTGPAGRGHRDALGHDPAVQVPPPVEVRDQSPRELPRVPVQAVGRGLGDGGE